MNLKPETQERITRVLCMVPNLVKLNAESRRGIEDAVLMILKEQDRDTRHACAEAVDNAIDDYYADNDMLKDIGICADRAHAACMNTHSI